jgi:hypothetical protein
MGMRPNLVEALMRSDPRMRVGDRILLPLDMPTDGPGQAAPEVLRHPLHGYPGVWRRESPPEERPARYDRAG